MERDVLAKRLQNAESVRWLPLSELHGPGVVSCIDGRHAGHTIGAPGGNAGELVLLLAVAEWYGAHPLTADQVRCLLQEQLRGLGRFYLHTDRDAVQSLSEKLGLDPATSDDVLRNPPAELRDRLLEELVKPEHVGCGHLKLLLTRPGDYRVRRELTEYVIAAFFSLLWEGDADLELAILEGTHIEEALVVFHSPSPIGPTTLVPALRDKDQAVFVSHLPALKELRRRTVELLLETSCAPGLEELDPFELRLELERLSERHLTLTLSALAPDLPRYRVSFEGRELTLSSD